MTKTTLPESLCDVKAYPNESVESVVLYETHISWIFLAGEHAYKVKKPLKLNFLDYSTLEQRKHHCQEEVRLNSRYAKGLYLGVVPITLRGGHCCVDGLGEVVDFAVKMLRFPEGSLLSDRLDHDELRFDEVIELSRTIARFHHDASVADRHHCWGSPNSILENAFDNIRDLRASFLYESFSETLNEIGDWSDEFFSEHQLGFSQRRVSGFIRECHGDLHLANVVQWCDQFVPFDGIEFNDEFRWIDVMSDAAFLGMDLAVRGRPDLSHSFLNGYLEQTGDHASLPILRWYLIYRAMVRAKVAAITAAQHPPKTSIHADSVQDCHLHLNYAHRLTRPSQPNLWITHGVSGSGKTTGSEMIVQHHGAIRLRSDIERKRHFGLHPDQHPKTSIKHKVYCESANQATYTRLERLARGILRAGYSVVVDATFLKREHRDRFAQLAKHEASEFHIVDFQADEAVLRRRVTDRLAQGKDASDADIDVLESQLASQEPLTSSELAHVIRITPPDTI